MTEFPCHSAMTNCHSGMTEFSDCHSGMTRKWDLVKIFKLSFPNDKSSFRNDMNFGLRKFCEPCHSGMTQFFDIIPLSLQHFPVLQVCYIRFSSFPYSSPTFPTNFLSLSNFFPYFPTFYRNFRIFLGKLSTIPITSWFFFSFATILQ